jgi:hypothetical protein
VTDGGESSDAPRRLGFLRFEAEQLLVQFADFFDGCFEPLIILQGSLHLSNLLSAQTDVADAAAGITDSENRDRVSLTALALGAALTMSDDPFEQRAAQDIARLGKASDESVALPDGLLSCHQ